MKKKNNKRAFTLLETIIAISITAVFFILASSIIISINRTYREMEKVNEMDYEVFDVYKIIYSTINSYNKDGNILTYLSDHEIKEETSLCLSINQDEEGNIVVQYQKANTDTYIKKYQRIKDITFLKRNLNLLEIKIIDDKNRERKMIVNIVGGIL